MRFYLLKIIFFLFVTAGHAQTTDTSRWLRAFPITDYIVEGNDSTKIVQVQMPDGLRIPEKTIGVLYGLYQGVKEDAVEKGAGRCQLIKGDYYYFAITNNKSGKAIKGGDIIYTLLPSSSIYYGYIPQLAGHYIELRDVYDSAFYNRLRVFGFWTEQNDKEAMEAMAKDIRFTGSYFKENNAAMDVKIKSGEYKDRSTFEMMIDCDVALLSDFFAYVFARPRLYAGREWKVSEIFATWLSEGAPKVIKK